MATESRLVVFVYGTLKRGHGNHATYMQGYDTLAEATVTGRLLNLSDSIPILAVPRANILLEAKGPPDHDLAQQQRICSSNPRDVIAPGTEQWVPVRGEVFTFSNDLANCIRRLDGLEGCTPGATGNMYDRVMVHVHGIAGITAAWTYIVPRDMSPEEYAPARDFTTWPAVDF